MRRSSRKVGTHQDLKTSSGLKQKHPFSRGWNSSESPTCFQPLHVFVYSHHGEETFCSQRRIAKPGRSSDATTKQTDSVPLRLNSLNCGVAPTCTAGFSPRHDEQLQKNLRPASEQDSSQPPQPGLTDSASTCLHQRDTTRRCDPCKRPKALILQNNRGLAKNKHHSTFWWSRAQKNNYSRLPPIIRRHGRERSAVKERNTDPCSTLRWQGELCAASRSPASSTSSQPVPECHPGRPMPWGQEAEEAATLCVLPACLPADLPLGQPLLALSSGNQNESCQVFQGCSRYFDCGGDRAAAPDTRKSEGRMRGQPGENVSDSKLGWSRDGGAVISEQCYRISQWRDKSLLLLLFLFFFGKLKKVGGPTLQGVNVFSPAQLWSITTA